MKTLFITIIALFSYITVSSAQEKQLKPISDNYYAYTENTINSDVYQTGYYILIDGKLLRDGEWKHYIKGELVSSAKYSKDNLVFLKINGIEFSNKELQILKFGTKEGRLAALK